MAKQTKDVFLKEADDIAVQIDELKKRREELQSQRQETSANIKSQTESISLALIDGRDVSKESKARSENRVLHEDLTMALSQVEFRLKELDRKYFDKQKSAVKVDFDALGDEACVLLLTCLDKLREAVSVLDALDAKFLELNGIGAAAGMHTDRDDNLRLVRQIGGYLRGDFSAADGIPNRIKQVEEGYPTILAYVKERAGAKK